MRLLLSSDVHCDLDAAHELVALSRQADVTVCAGDLAVERQGLSEVVELLSSIAGPVVLVPGNGESDRELAAACSDWPDAHVLHGSGVQIDGLTFWGIGGAIRAAPLGGWHFELTEGAARELFVKCPPGSILVSHSPPFGHVDVAGDRHLGSHAVLEAIQRTQPLLTVCGHIHGCWRQEAMLGSTRVVNAGPGGILTQV